MASTSHRDTQGGTSPDPTARPAGGGAPPMAQRPAWPVKVVAQRNFGAYFVGNLASNCGTWFQNVAQALLVYRLTGSTLLVGVANFAQFVGVLVLAPWSGAAADRFDRRKLLMVTQAGALAVSAALAAVALAGHAGVVVVMTAALLLGVATAFATPALQSLVPALVSREDLPAAVAMNTVTFTLARAVGPVLGALVVAHWGIPVAFAMNTVTYVILILALLYVRPADVRSAMGGRGRPTLLASLREIRSDAVVMTMLAVVAAVAVSGDPVNTLTPAFTDIYHRPDTYIGVMIGAFGLGSVIAALTVTRPASTRRTAMVMAMMGGATVVFAVSGTLVLGLAALSVCGFGFLAAQTAATVTLQLHVHESQRGRVMAVWSVAWLGTRPIASLVDGAIASLATARVAAAVMAAPVLAAAVVLGVLGKRHLVREPNEALPGARGRADGGAGRTGAPEVPSPGGASRTTGARTG